MRVADYISNYLTSVGLKHIFMLPGGAAMHLNDAFGKNPNLTVVFNLHEQASAISAEAYSRITGGLGAVNITAGPGSTNTITGLAGAWLDSSPVIFLSGQVKTADLKKNTELRQYGVQEIDTVSLVKNLTKYAVTITDPKDVRYHLEKALYLAMMGRRGPVWLDIPLDVQGAEIIPEELETFTVTESVSRRNDLLQSCEKVLRAYKQAKRPVLIVGNGVRAAGGIDKLHELIDIWKIPSLTSWLGMDLIDEENENFYGRPGGIAPRYSNFIVQNSDFLLTIGARLDLGMVAYDYKNFARDAKKFIVDVDINEINKLGFEIEQKIEHDAGEFLEKLVEISSVDDADFEKDEWLLYCRKAKAKYPLFLSSKNKSNRQISMYQFSDQLSDLMEENDIIASCSSGFAAEIFLLMYRHKKGQRIFHNRGTGSMGFGLPAAIGACIASENRRTICVEGEGGFQMNIQELETISRLSLNIKIFVINNGGYSSIRASQKNYFGRIYGADNKSGISFPSTSKIARAYGLNTKILDDPSNLKHEISQILASNGPTVCEVIVQNDEPREPRLATVKKPDGKMVSRPLEDMYPFLDREELQKMMFIPTIPE